MAKKGFFKKDVGEVIKEAREDCSECGLIDLCHSPHLSYTGKGKLGIAILYSHPEFDQDDTGELSCGKDYTFLTRALDDIGISLEEDCYYIPVLGCRTPRNRHPKKVEVGYCAPRLKRFLKRLDPNVVILLGSTPFDAIVHPRISGRLTGTPYNKFYGECIPDQELQVWICPTWSVEELMDTKEYEDGKRGKPLWERDRAVFNLWKDHLYNACSLYTRKVEVVDYVSLCKTTQDVDVALGWIEEAMSWDKCAFDYETSGRKGYTKGHHIRCVSISNGSVSYAFPFFDDKMFRLVWRNFLLSDTKKISHNLQFEATWSKLMCGEWPLNWLHDTMLGEHQLRNWGATGLKYAVYKHFGVIGYDDSCDKYLKSSTADEKLYGANAFNKIDDAPMGELTQYCAMDSLFTFRIYELQMGLFEEFQLVGNKLLTESSVTLAKMSYNGFRVSSKDFDKVEEQLQKLVEEKKQEILATEEAKLWDKETPFNFNSSQQLGHLLFDIMKIKPVGYTKTGNASLDEESLTKIGLPFLFKILKWRELSKMCSTYINGWKREAVDNIVHPYYNANTVDTFRTSSNSPNAQNNYKRDPEKRKIVRSIIAPREGCRIIEYDLHGAETYFNLFYSGDHKFEEYLLEPGSDMHKDFGVWLFLMERAEVTKEYRSAVKGDGTFALLYGSYYVQVAKSLWEYIVETPALLAHLASKGITEYTQYEKVVQKAEERFWGPEMFGLHDEWRKRQWKEYQHVGYVDTLTGFRLSCPMSRNNSFNGPPQGSAAHALLWIINRMQEKAEELNWKSILIGEIHDSHLWDVYPDEESIIDYWVWFYTTQAIQKEWTWITIPLVVEKERSALDGTWAIMYDCGELNGDLCKPKKPEERDL